MSSRDDRDALLARAEALEREAERLRRENDELRAASELARGARRAARAPGPPPARDPRFEERRRERLVDQALSPTWSRATWILGLAALVPVTVGLGVAVNAILGWFGSSISEHAAGPMAWLVLVLGYLGGVHVARERARRVEARHQRAWLAALPVPFERERYLSLLSMARPRAIVEVTLRFTDAVPAQERGALADTVRRTGRRIADARWTDDHLVIRSRVLKTRFRGPKGGIHHDNVRVHRWFRALARDVLMPLSRLHPLEIVQLA